MLAPRGIELGLDTNCTDGTLDITPQPEPVTPITIDPVAAGLFTPNVRGARRPSSPPR